MNLIRLFKRIFHIGFLNKGFKKGDIIIVEDKKYPENNGDYKIKKAKKDRLILE